MGAGRCRGYICPAEVRIVASELHQRNVAAGYGFGVLLGYLRAARHGATHATVIVDICLQVVGTLTDKTRRQNLVTFSVINHSFGNRVAQSDNLL